MASRIADPRGDDAGGVPPAARLTSSPTSNTSTAGSRRKCHRKQHSVLDDAIRRTAEPMGRAGAARRWHSRNCAARSPAVRSSPTSCSCSRSISRSTRMARPSTRPMPARHPRRDHLARSECEEGAREADPLDVDGCPLGWLIHPETRTIDVFRPAGRPSGCPPDGVLEGEPVAAGVPPAGGRGLRLAQAGPVRSIEPSRSPGRCPAGRGSART